MTERLQTVKARAQRALTRSTLQAPGAFHGPAHPDQHARLERAVRSLPRATREIILAHLIDGYSYTDIGAMTGLGCSQVEQRISDALYLLECFMDGNERTPWRRWWQARIPRWLR